MKTSCTSEETKQKTRFPSENVSIISNLSTVLSGSHYHGADSMLKNYRLEALESPWTRVTERCSATSVRRNTCCRISSRWSECLKDQEIPHAHTRMVIVLICKIESFKFAYLCTMAAVFSALRCHCRKKSHASALCTVKHEIWSTVCVSVHRFSPCPYKCIICKRVMDTNTFCDQIECYWIISLHH